VDRLALVGNSRHMRLRLKQGHHLLGAICFCATTDTFPIQPGDIVDVAFQPQVNEFRGVRSVQLNVQDIRPACKTEVCVETADYGALCRGTLTPAAAERLLPDRSTLGTVWRYLAAVPEGALEETADCLCRKIVRRSEMPLTLEKLLVCLDVFADVGLLELRRQHRTLIIRLLPREGKADLQTSPTLQKLQALKESR